MRSKLIRCFFILLLFFNHLVFAEQTCTSITPHNNTIDLEVQGGSTQSLSVDVAELLWWQTYYLWYAGDEQNSSHYIFHEDDLEDGKTYHVRVNYYDGLGYVVFNYSLYDSNWHQLKKESDIRLLSWTISNFQFCQQKVEEPDEFELSQCAYFPDSFQSNTLANSGNSTLSLSGDRTTLSLSTKRELAFSQIITSGNSTGCKYANGSVESCLYDANLIYDQFPANLSGFVGNGSDVVCMDGCSKELSPGSYNKIEIGRNNSHVILSEGEYWVNNLVFSSDGAKLSVSGKVILHFNSILLQGDRIKINESGDPDDLWLLGHSGTQDFRVAKNDVTIHASLFLDADGYANGVTVQADRFIFQGSITASKISVSGNDSFLVGTNLADCTGTQPSSYELVLTPASDYSLICDDLSPTLSVMSGGSLANSFNGSASVTIDGIKQNVAVNNGTANITLSSGGASNAVAVTASLVDHSDVASVSGSYQFVPYTFKVDEQYVIANKPQTVTAQAMACSNGSAVDAGYSGSPSAQREWVIPTNGVGEVIYAPQFSHGQASAELTLQDAGQATITLQDSNFDCTGFDSCPFNGSDTLTGQFTVYSRPWTFALCSPTGSAMDGDISDKNSLGFAAAGEAFALNIRPLRWVAGGSDSDPLNGSDEIDTSAYCNAPVTENFFAANSVTANVELSYEVAQPAGGADGTLSGTLSKSNNEGSNNSYLAFSDLSWSEAGVLRVKADTAANYLQMNVNLGYRDIGRFYPAWLSLISNNWDYASNHDEFMYMSQPITYDFVVEAQNINGDATSNYSQFSPALRAEIKLFAVQYNKENELLNLIKRIDKFEDLISDYGDIGAWSSAQFTPDDKDFMFVKQYDGESSTPDGPFADGFGLVITSTADDVEFKVCDADSDTEIACQDALLFDSDVGRLFDTQPDIRYGRMVMSDVGGTSTQEKINIPLKVQYWDGLRFVTNTDDSGSHYHSNNDYVCTQSVWVDENHTGGSDSSNSSLVPIDTNVDLGASTELFATPHNVDNNNSRREQIRFWLRMSDTSPQRSELNVSCGSSFTDQPWLQYNWRDQGDEDPSAVVTFGVYRGNDRIIFRGESGLTGQ
ncbi:MAG: DUF6701 domain-containing protein [Vibrio sp.]|uniref:DUF6701 domain-containing protein n=1 Tax=Vibrio sp. TaxID=678 RepID=UPI003A8A0577